MSARPKKYGPTMWEREECGPHREHHRHRHHLVGESAAVEEDGAGHRKAIFTNIWNWFCGRTRFIFHRIFARVRRFPLHHSQRHRTLA